MKNNNKNSNNQSDYVYNNVSKIPRASRRPWDEAISAGGGTSKGLVNGNESDNLPSVPDCPEQSQNCNYQNLYSSCTL